MRIGFVWLILCALLPVGITANQNTPDAAAAASLEAFRDNPELLFDYMVLGQHPAEITEGGVVYLGMVDLETGTPVEGFLELMVVLPVANGWQAWRPGELGFDAALSALPTNVRLGIDTSTYKPPADPDLVPPQQLRAYGLPYPHGDFGTVTRSFGVHGTGTLDFDLTGRDVAAAKDGTIVYANDSYQSNGPWWYWNTVVIAHGEGEYTLYGHLAPGSIPDAIRAACREDTSGSNCEYPVARGEVIGAEGNTGRSSNLHLHLEFGQALNFVALPDISDDDRDGNRDEPVWTPLLYREQNAGFIGYSPDAVAGWQWGRVEQAGHFSPVPLHTNVVLNPTFDNGTSGWRASGQLNWAVEGGVLRAIRLRTDEAPNFAAFYQFINYSVYAGDAFEVTLELGNAGGVPKTAQVELLSASGAAYGGFGCTFEVPPGAGLAPRTVRGVVGNTWANALLRVSVNPPDGSPALLVDNISVRRVEGAAEAAACG